MRARGTVETGIGEGAKYVALYNRLFEHALGFTAFLGTLNVRTGPVRLPAGIVVQRPGGYKVACYAATARANRRVLEGAVVVPERSAHRGVLEFIAPCSAREALRVNDGDVVALTIRTKKASNKARR